MQIFNVFLPFQDLLHWLITSLTNATLSYGLAIILFTIIIRLILSPLYVIQIRSSKKMTELSPKIKEIQKRYSKDREALTRETMALYKEHNHNPALGCLLPFIQIPILWSLFIVLRGLSNGAALKAQHLAHYQLYSAHFLWLDLGKPDAYHILPIVAGITQWIQQRMMLQPTNDPQQRQMQQIMQFLPLMIVVFAWQYPSGLAVYWVTSNIIMMIMQYLISGWGSLFTSPFSIPFPGDIGPSYSPGAQLARGGMARAFSSRQNTSANGSGTTNVKAPRQDANGARPGNGKPGKSTPPEPAPPQARLEAPAPDEPLLPSDRQSKMERYAARHGRGVSRGRPSAKGAKK